MAYDFGFSRSPNGVIEYQHDGFGGSLVGKLIVVRFSSGDDLVVLVPSPSGDMISSNDAISSLDGFVDPIDLVETPANGFLYVSEFDQADGQGTITLLRPLEPQPELTEDTYYFNDPSGGDASSVQTIFVENTTGEEIVLTVGSIALSGGQAGEFSIVTMPSLPAVLPTGETVEFGVAFDPVSNGIKATQFVVQTGVPTIPQLTTDVRGLGHSGFQGSGEPALNSVLQL